MGLPKQANIFYYGQPTLAEFPKDKDNEIKTGSVLFTQTGEQLVNICGAKRNQEFYEYAIEQLSKQGITLSSHLPNK